MANEKCQMTNGKSKVIWLLLLMLLAAAVNDLLTQFAEQVNQIVGVFLFDRQDTFHQTTRRWVVIREVVNHVAITVDSDPFSDQIFFDHVNEGFALDIFGVAAS